VTRRVSVLREIKCDVMKIIEVVNEERTKEIKVKNIRLVK
jgi:hypothetical protein